MAPAQALPPELLSLVFFAIYSGGKGKAKLFLTRTSYELLDTLLVCRRWNDIACQTPQLWTTVYVAHDHQASVRAQTYADRARCLKLDVVLASSSNSSSVENCGNALQGLLRKHASRLRSITLPFLTQHISESLQTPLPNLLSFTCDPITSSDFEISHSPDFDSKTVTLDTPKLETLVLQNYAISFAKNNWPTLLRLDCLFCPGDENWVWGLLGASQHTLESLVLCDAADTLETWAVHSHTLDDGVIPYTSLPNLTDLEVVGMEEFDWPALRFAEMPALVSLRLTLVDLPDSENQETPLPTFERLQRLYIATSFEVDDNLQYLLQSAPNISSLEVIDISKEDDSDNSDIIGSLLLGEPLLCPNLQQIGILGISVHVSKLEELVDLRLPTLRKITLGSGRWEERSGVEEQQRARDQARLDRLNKRVELSGLTGWWDESSAPQSST
ncbi:hypothetical protein FRC00_005150 [Tulasnella sp. 408]|nr:hypothetical protein FRC00_005150 [Tulasnella sp. 408]